jgi:NhaA family Na+:H+ antiporter
MPIFALANTDISLSGNWAAGLISSNALGIFSGLFIGKALGILLFSFLAVKFGLSKLPNEVNWSHIIGAGFLGGIGFTMSIFITLLAFDQADIIQSSKISILLGSLASGLVGYFILNKVTSNNPTTDQ